MKLEKISLLLTFYGNLKFSDNCIDCGEKTTVGISLEPANKTINEEHIVIEGGAVYEHQESFNYPVPIVVKCQKCFDIDPQIHQVNEIYSRCVGYLGPVVSWNTGKKAEFKQRAMFDLGSEIPKEEREGSCGCSAEIPT